MTTEVFIAMIFPRRTAVRLVAAPIAFLAIQQLARADMVYTIDAFYNIGIYYGSAQLFSPGGTLLSTTYAMTVETTMGCQELGSADGAACAAALSNAVVAGLANPKIPVPPPPVFSEYFESQLPSFADDNGLGNAAPISFDSGFDPTTTPTATSEALYTDLTSQPGSFVVTGDTSFVPYGAPFDYVFAFDITFPVPYVTNNNPPCCATTEVATMNVQFFERDLQLTEVATPEPRGIAVAGVLMLLWFSRVGARAT
jgi:hypothetical protein